MKKIRLIFAVCFCFIALFARADDTEIYYGFSGGGGSDQTDKPVILLVLDTSGRMNAIDPSLGQRSLSEIMIEGVKLFLENATGVKVGLVRFANQSGAIAYPVRDIDQHRSELLETANAIFTVSDNTAATLRGDQSNSPIVDVLYESALYLRGDPVDLGTTKGLGYISESVLSHPGSYTGGEIQWPDKCDENNLSSPACKDIQIIGNPEYISPLNASGCTGGHIVLISGGHSNPTHKTEEIKTLTSQMECLYDTSKGQGEICGRELVEFLHNADQRSDLAGQQTVTTHTISLKFGHEFMEDLATHGGGQFLPVTSVDKLNIQSALMQVARDTQYTRNFLPVVGVNVATNPLDKLTHRTDAYFSLFKPDRAGWLANVKKFKRELTTNGIRTLDINNQEVQLHDGGTSNQDTQSFWSSTQDGNDISRGGIVEHFSLNRKLFSNLSLQKNLAASSNDVSKANEGVSTEILGVQQNEREKWIDWLRGKDSFDDNENTITDELREKLFAPAMHSKPVVIDYKNRSVLFVSTTDGFLHAFDTHTGQELFSFIPQDLISKVIGHAISDGGMYYGLDGDLVPWLIDNNNDGLIDASNTQGNGDKAYLYACMRRGGQSCYALDVTDMTQPMFMFQVQGGVAPFSELAQTWSKPLKTQIMLNNVKRDVLVFGGGYDANTQDNAKQYTMDTIGRAIYMIDALTGELIWNAAQSNANLILPMMKNSFPADLFIADVDYDGLLDHLYAVDVGGQLFRFDFNHKNSGANNLASGGRIALLNPHSTQSTEASYQQNRRFFAAPDVAITNKGLNRYLSISLGSGNRAHPLSTNVPNHFYVIKDRDVLTPNKGVYQYNDVTVDDLIQLTNNSLPIDMDAAPGFYLELDDGTMLGEKILSQAITTDGYVFFTSYLPEQNNASCSNRYGMNRVYALHVRNGQPHPSFSKVADDGSKTHHYFVDLYQTGIASSPKLTFPPLGNGTPNISVGEEMVRVAISGWQVKRERWRQVFP